MNTINFPKPTCPSKLTLSSTIPTKNPNFLSLNPSNSSGSSTQIVKTLNPRQRKTPPFLSFCSTKPNTQNENTTDENTNPSDEFQSNLDNPEQEQGNQLEPNSKQTQLSGPTLSSRGLVFDLGPTGCWDSTDVGSPVVKRFLSDDEERWYMWYCGTDSIGLAVSSNGVHWKRGEETGNSGSETGVVMKCGEDWWAFDTMSIRPSEVMVMSSAKVRAASAVYWLYYTGFSSEEVELPGNLSLQFGLFNPERSQVGEHIGVGRVYKFLPGLAISQDGKYWARLEGDHHSGALFDVGSNGEWDSLFIASPHVVFHNKGDLRMYYHSFDPQNGKFAIGMARSRDGIKWVKLGKIMSGGLSEGCFDEMGMLNACVVKDNKNGTYLMAYEGVAKDGKRGIGMAVSPDGLKDWTRVSDASVLIAASEDGWDSKGVGSPCLVQMDGEEDRWRLYYTGVGVDGRTGIGLAVSQGSEVISFRRWSGFHM